MIVVSASTGRSSRLANNSRKRARASARLGSGGLGEAVEELAGREPPDGHRGKHRRRRFGLARHARQVVGPGRRQDADQELQIVAVRPELTRQFVEQAAQLRTGVALKIIHRFDQADAEEASPDAVDDGSGEIGVIGRGDPLGQDLAGIGARTPCRRGTVEVGRLDDLLGPRDRQLPARGGIRFPTRDDRVLQVPRAARPRRRRRGSRIVPASSSANG